MTIPEPQRGELLDEITAGFTAIADLFRAERETPPNPEREGAALDTLDAVIDALTEMREQQEATE